MGEEIDDREFDELLADKRHKELTGALKGIATLLNKPEKDDKAIVDAIKKQGDSLDKVAAAIQNQPKPEKPEVNVVTDNKEIIPLLKEINDGQLELKKVIKEASENKPMVDKFEIRNLGGGTHEAKVIYKPASQITFKK